MRLIHSIGIFGAISVSIFVLTGCGAGTGQSLSSPTLSSRGTGDGTGAADAAGTRAAGSVLPAKRFGLFLTDAVPEKGKVVGNTSKPTVIASTDNTTPATEYSHVYVTVHKVELLTADEQAFPVWADDAGRVVDLTTLRDATGERVALLGGVPVPGATGKKAYKRVRITLGKGITFLKRGETAAATTPIADAIGRDDEGRPVLTVTLDRPRDLGTGKEDLILAFDRSSFTFADGRVTPAVHEGRAGISTDPARQEPVTMVGAVSETTAGGDGPERIFALLPDGGAKGESLVVWMRSSAVFFRADGKPSPTLTDDAKVAVTGVLQPSTKRVIATTVTLLPADEKASENALVAGSASNASVDSGTFTVSTEQVRNLPPTRTNVTINLASDAVLRSTGGLTVTKSEFFETLKKGEKELQAEAEGDYEPTTGVLTARRARLVSSGSDEKAAREAAVFAVAESVSESGKSLTVTAPLAEWDGIAPPAPGKAWTVNTAVSTQCYDADGKSIALGDLLAAAKQTEKNAVRIIGLYQGGTITATRLELHPAPVKEKPETIADAKTGDKGDKTAKKTEGAKAEGTTKDKPAAEQPAEQPVKASSGAPPTP